MRAKVLAALVYPAEASRGALGNPAFDVLIDRTGMLRALRLTATSGSVAVDRAVALAIQNAAPFEPPPSEIPGNFVPIHLQFRVGPQDLN